VSGKIVDISLLRKSAHSGALALENELERCGLTHVLVLPNEMEACAVTGIRAIREKMVRSDVSGRYVVPQKAIRSAVSNKVGLPDEVVNCAWLEKPILRNEAKSCALSGIYVTATLLNDHGELRLFRELLDGKSPAAARHDHLVPVLKSIDTTFFKPLRYVWAIRSPGGGKLALCCELRTWLGLKVRYVGLLLKKEDTYSIISRGVMGYRDKEAWKLEDKVAFQGN
jgi:hypothetical protein